MFGLALATILTVFAPQQNGDFVSDFITSDAKCIKGEVTACAHVQELCTLLTPARRSSVNYSIRNDYPFKSKNGGMNIAARYSMALRRCQ